MIRVVDKKVVKHLIRSEEGLLEIPIRIHFEYSLESQLFISGSMVRRYLFNRQAVLDRLPGMAAEQLDRDIEEAVDESLIEHLKFNHQAVGEINLFQPAESDEPDNNQPRNDEKPDDPESPGIIIP